MKKIKRYILKPYEIRPTMCFIRLIWLLRKSIYLEYRMAIVETQDELRVWKLHLAQMMQPISELYIVMGMYLEELNNSR